MIVYALFSASGEGDSYTVYDLEAIASSIERAKELAVLCESYRFQPVHASMNAENRFVFVGKRDDCSTNCPYGWHGGFVIEAIEVQ